MKSSWDRILKNKKYNIPKKNVSKIVKEVIRYRNEEVDNINNRDNLINSILENLN